jgi:predicted nucleotidyltransferase
VKPQQQSCLDDALAALNRELGANLHSCCLYGSAVRGNDIEGVSDLNLLIVLNQSTSQAHQAVARALKGRPQIDVFILARRGFERSVRAFAPKFASIRRNYRVLCGADPLAIMPGDSRMEKFLCEQSLRNLRLRLVYSFVMRERHQSYDRFLVSHVSPLFVQFSEILRLEGIAMPKTFEERIPVMEKEFGIDGQVLRDLLALKKSPKRFSGDEAVAWHDRIFPLVDKALAWVESKWQL